LRFLQSCERHLNPDGLVLLVANRFLPYERMMPMSLVAEDTKFKVLKGRLTTR
jgi:16S rRNA G1207 methylase RsmC